MTEGKHPYHPVYSLSKDGKIICKLVMTEPEKEEVWKVTFEDDLFITKTQVIDGVLQDGESYTMFKQVFEKLKERHEYDESVVRKDHD